MDLFKDLIFDNLVRAALVELKAAVPFLAIPPFSWAVDYLVTLFADKLYAAVKLFIDTERVIIINQQTLQVYTRDSVKLKILANDHGIDSEEFKNAREASKVDLSKFIRIGRNRAA